MNFTLVAIVLSALAIGFALGRIYSEVTYARRRAAARLARSQRRAIKGLEDRPPAHPGALGTARVREAKIRDSRQMHEE